MHFIVAYPNFLATLANFKWTDEVSFYQETTGMETRLGEAFAAGRPRLNGLAHVAAGLPGAPGPASDCPTPRRPRPGLSERAGDDSYFLSHRDPSFGDSLSNEGGVESW